MPPVADRIFEWCRRRVTDPQPTGQSTPDLGISLVEVVARAIDAGDQATQTHLRNVVTYATGLARAVGMPEGEIRGLHVAALLHDIGKLAVPQHILSKPGPLTPDEFEKIRSHPKAGADIIASVPFPYPVASIVLSHHERWDGRGYPQGLTGEEIPLGARILTIADYFDAVTTERPYHKAMARDGAISLIRHEAGRVFDPRLVEAFVRLLHEIAADKPTTEAEPASVATGMTASRPPTPPAGTVFEDLGRSQREMYVLYEIAETMGTTLGLADTAALITTKLGRLVPWSACALFIYEPGADTLRCRFTAGPDVNRLQNLGVRTGEGLAGCVAGHRQTLVNANPRVSFEAAGVAADTSLKSAIVAPLLVGQTFLGALALYHREERQYTGEHRRLLERVAQQASLVLRNAMTFERVQEDSLTDPLTGLPNRRSMFMHLSRELARAGRLHGESALIVMDVDNFKAINDTYGHGVGDEVLRAVAKTLRSALRPYDLCVRYAGDEFIIVLADCPRGMVDAKCLELRQRISAIAYEASPGRPLVLESSAGAAVFPHDGRTYEGLLEVADQRMYLDKAARRTPTSCPPTADAYEPSISLDASAEPLLKPSPTSGSWANA